MECLFSENFKDFMRGLNWLLSVENCMSIQYVAQKVTYSMFEPVVFSLISLAAYFYAHVEKAPTCSALWHQIKVVVFSVLAAGILLANDSNIE